MISPDFATALPVIFMVLLGLAMLVYVVLDGFDLGVGLLLPLADDADKDRMVASIGPFWDANETWLVLGVGLLLIAFPLAHGVILGALYVPVTLMLLGLILRGVAFDFRVKVKDPAKVWWNRAFSLGSWTATLAQGWMLGRYITGLRPDGQDDAFAALIALSLAACYALLGACWLILKTEDALQARAIAWAKRCWPAVVLGLLAISVATPWVSASVRAKWFSLPDFFALLPIPLMSAVALLSLRALLNSHRIRGKLCGLPFALTVLVIVLGSFGLAYSLYPHIVMDRMTIWEAAASPQSLAIILVGCVITLPMIAAYSVFAYRVFGGKVRELHYA